MNKDIDAEQLAEKIEGIGLYAQKSADYNDGRNDMKMMVLDLIDSLQQEQSAVDLEKEMDRFFEEMPVLEYENIFEETYQMIARHFYELGLNTRKEE